MAGHPLNGNGPIIELAPHLEHCHTLSRSPFFTFIELWLLKSLICITLSLNTCRAQLFSLPANLTETGIFVFDIGNKKSVRLDSLKPLACRYRQTPFTERFGEYNIPRLFSYQYVLRQPIFLPLI